MMNLGLLGLGSHARFFLFLLAQEPLTGTDNDTWTAGGMLA